MNHLLEIYRQTQEHNKIIHSSVLLESIEFDHFQFNRSLNRAMRLQNAFLLRLLFQLIKLVIHCSLCYYNCRLGFITEKRVKNSRIKMFSTAYCRTSISILAKLKMSKMKWATKILSNFTIRIETWTLNEDETNKSKRKRPTLWQGDYHNVAANLHCSNFILKMDSGNWWNEKINFRKWFLVATIFLRTSRWEYFGWCIFVVFVLDLFFFFLFLDAMRRMNSISINSCYRYFCALWSKLHGQNRSFSFSICLMR